MSDHLLLIPGTSGNKLLLDGVDLGWPGLLSAEAWLCGANVFDVMLAKLGVSTEELIAVLSMEFADVNSAAPTKTTLKAGSAVAPGAVLGAAYNQFQDATPFTYDWRSDLRDNAQKLLTFLETNKPTGGKWKIVAHSQGGLLVPIAAHLAGVRGGVTNASAFSALVSHVGFCAVPFHGCINAADALANGSGLAADFQGAFRKVVATWPAIYQMLASYPGSAPNATLLDAVAWPAGVVDPALLARAADTHRTYFRFPLVFLNGVKVRISLSMGHPTHDAASFVGTTLLPSGQEPGDTLVPYTSTTAAMTDAERQAVLGFHGPTAEHSLLLNDPAVASDLRQFLAS